MKSMTDPEQPEGEASKFKNPLVIRNYWAEKKRISRMKAKLKEGEQK